MTKGDEREKELARWLILVPELVRSGGCDGRGREPESKATLLATAKERSFVVVDRKLGSLARETARARATVDGRDALGRLVDDAASVFPEHTHIHQAHLHTPGTTRRLAYRVLGRPRRARSPPLMRHQWTKDANPREPGIVVPRFAHRD
jgi:hypothetical protein